jgi:hypothetical protein
VRENPVHVAHVLLNHGYLVVAGKDMPGVGHRHGVDVDIYHSAVRGHTLYHLVDVAQRRDPGAEVEELADTRLHQEPHRPVQEGAVALHDDRYLGDERDRLTPRLPIDREVVAAT